MCSSLSVAPSRNEVSTSARVSGRTLELVEDGGPRSAKEVVRIVWSIVGSL
jgi:hypothetical protein